MKTTLCLCLPLLCLVLAAGCGSKKGTSESKPGDQKPAGLGGRMTIDNTSRILSEKMTFNDVKMMFASTGERTNEEKPGLAPGSSKYVWTEDGKKVYVSFGPDGKANGVAWEGFGGR